MMDHHQQFTSVGRGIRWDILPSRLYERGKRLGTWNPQDLDFKQDVLDWKQMPPAEKALVLRLAASFGAGEEAVTLDLLPLLMVMAQEGRLEEEMYLTNFLFEESKHTEFFRRLLDAIGCNDDLNVSHTPAYRTIFYEELPRAMSRLLTDPSPEAQADASVTYNMIVEGVLAETGYYAWGKLLEPRGLMPATRQGLALIARDEARHIAYGVYLLSRLVAADDTIYARIEQRMGMLLVPALQMLGGGGQKDGFGLTGSDPHEVAQFARRKFQARMAVIERARGQAVDDLYTAPAEHFEPDLKSQA